MNQVTQARKRIVAAQTEQLTVPRYTYPPEVFGYLVAEVLKQYTPAQRTAFRAGFLGAMLETPSD